MLLVESPSNRANGSGRARDATKGASAVLALIASAGDPRDVVVASIASSAFRDRRSPRGDV